MIRKAHLAIGLSFVVVFLATGVFMAFSFPEPGQDDFGKRMMYRSAHIYILLTALANVLVGAYFERRSQNGLRRIQLVGSIMLLAAPMGFTIAFFVEPDVATLERPVCLLSTFLTLLGVALLTYGKLKRDKL